MNPKTPKVSSPQDRWRNAQMRLDNLKRYCEKLTPEQQGEVIKALYTKGFSVAEDIERNHAIARGDACEV